MIVQRKIKIISIVLAIYCIQFISTRVLADEFDQGPVLKIPMCLHALKNLTYFSTIDDTKSIESEMQCPSNVTISEFATRNQVSFLIKETSQIGKISMEGKALMFTVLRANPIKTTTLKITLRSKNGEIISEIKAKIDKETSTIRRLKTKSSAKTTKTTKKKTTVTTKTKTTKVSLSTPWSSKTSKSKVNGIIISSKKSASSNSKNYDLSTKSRYANSQAKMTSYGYRGRFRTRYATTGITSFMLQSNHRNYQHHHTSFYHHRGRRQYYSRQCHGQCQNYGYTTCSRCTGVSNNRCCKLSKCMNCTRVMIQNIVRDDIVASAFIPQEFLNQFPWNLTVSEVEVLTEGAFEIPEMYITLSTVDYFNSANKLFMWTIVISISILGQLLQAFL